MANKLQNIKAVKEMMAGTHKSQRRTSVYMGTTATEVPEEDILEKFEDGKPKVWIERDNNGNGTKVTQHSGFKSREPENSILKSINEILHIPNECPECGTNMREKESRLNAKFWFKRKKCFSCVLKEEQKIKAQGPEAWKAYENNIMSANAESWFKDCDKEVEILKKQVKETIWGNAQGETGTVDVTSFIEKMETDYLELKTNIRNSFTDNIIKGE